MQAFDILIIGSGLGGLVCANILTKEGFRVAVLEKNKHFGGNLQTFARNKVIFDTGVHYIGGLSPGQNLHRYFSYLGIAEQLRLHRMDMEGYDYVSFDHDQQAYPYAQGAENFVQQLARFFPDEKNAIQQYYDKIKAVCESFPLYNLQSGIPYFLNEPIMSLKADEVINGLTSNPKLRAVLAGTNFLYAGMANKTPFYVHALSVNSYIESAWRCVGGGGQIAKALIREIRRYGGVVLKQKEVNAFRIAGNRIVSIHTSDGNQYEAGTVISNIDAKQTLSLCGDYPIRKTYVNRVRALQPTISSFSLYIVLKPQSFPYINHNYYHFKDENNVWTGVDYVPEEWPEGYMVSFTSKDGDSPWAEGMTVLTYMHYEETKKWENTFNTVGREDFRGADYERFKLEKTERVLQELEKKFPDIRSHILRTYAATPLTYRDYIGSDSGGMYGYIKDANAPLKSYLPPKTKLDNLLLTGQSVNMHGILGVTISAILTCSELIDRDLLLAKIHQTKDITYL